MASAVQRMSMSVVRRARVQYASDLYVDSYEKIAGAHLVKPAAPILVLSGGIGRGSSFQTVAFLAHCSRLWDHVIYVPGRYDLEGRTDFPLKTESNVSVLMNSHIDLRSYGLRIMGTPHITDFDRDYLVRSFLLSKESPMKLVAVTSRLPANPCLLPFNAWIGASRPGARTTLYNNGVLVAYNSRGHMAGPNDFTGEAGWRRDAVLVVPDNHHGDDGPLPELAAAAT